MTHQSRDLIITAASDSYRSQLLAFLGSLRCNWPDHPPVTVYDMGLREGTQQLLEQAGFDVRLIPPFVPHWRKHYTWKLWSMNDASAERVLWLDAGCCVLRPIPEVFDIIGQQGYFVLPNHQPLQMEASEEACEGCGVTPQFREGKVTVTAAVFGYRRGSPVQLCVQEALSVARTERFIKATKPWHRWEQAILSLLIYREITPLILCDATTYFSEDIAARFTTHAIWAARRNMHYKDKRFYASCLTGPTQPHTPRGSHKTKLWYVLAWYLRAAVFSLRRSRNTALDGVK